MAAFWRSALMEETRLKTFLTRGSFVTGGYTGTISNCCGNPLAGRQAWTGNSGGFISTTVALPIFAWGPNMVLRWRMGSDNSVSGEGWRVDTVVITQCHKLIPPTPQPRPTPAPRPLPSAPPSPHGTPAFTPAPRPSPVTIRDLKHDLKCGRTRRKHLQQLWHCYPPRLQHQQR